MSPEQWQRVKEVAGAALELEAERRGQFLEQECGEPTASCDGRWTLYWKGIRGPDRRSRERLRRQPPRLPRRRVAPGKNLQAGQTISHYQVIEKLGEGGMGVVYKAEDTKLERSVALKFLAVHAIEDPEHKARFIREAKAAARLDHQNICPVYEIDEVEGQTFLAMTYLEGRTVKDKIAERPLKLDEALDIAIQIAQGLKAAHEKEIIPPRHQSRQSDADQRRANQDYGLRPRSTGRRIEAHQNADVAGNPGLHVSRAGSTRTD